MISVEAGFETVVLEGTDVAISSPFYLTVDRDDGLRIRATVDVVENRRLVCRHLELATENGEIDSKLLRGLSLATWLRQGANGAVWRVGEPTVEEPAVAGSRFDRSVIMRDLRRYMTGIPRVGPRELTDAFLEEVAAAYRQAIENHEPTAAAVARLQRTLRGLKTNAEETTARRWIHAARTRGFLEPTVKGRKGG